ncbi:NAD(P)-dependent dehydrogenase (short-subunit alcohol dehydrogenase family) [Allocatelliglobosispora scoriae]|uniref:NAD(P)-dependent dehydrogenase (Short-subunit alcohol dehydrogenase family) n=1 Tax=Allocatelliglobosispora scoriae TaxID=643052 RepID=A0A841BM02_9ACTN|nr:SDR family NAD(P)-dependent oxidoreductase [Allocatelliglobosispora scoriae]MBB5867782.1 NAD(P)-dependent dehydrogenase (short-subunit alcohol dehydrogenase family) [Allocatelliglobosispora scoriae]
MTGGTAGIGRQIAAKLRSAGLTVLVTGRDQQRGAAAAADLGATFLSADHATIAGNLDLARRVRELAPRLDVLVNNVGGAAFPQRTVTAEGHEATLALNYLGPIVLTRALLPTLTADARVVQVVSSAFTMHSGDPFTEPAGYTAISAYARAKQLNLLATLSLARQLTGDATVNAVNPGMAWTPGVQALTPQSVPAWRYIWPLVRMIQRRAAPEKAARIPALLALHPDGTGRFYESDGKAKPLPQRLLDPALQARAWQTAVDLTSPPSPTGPEHPRKE